MLEKNAPILMKKPLLVLFDCDQVVSNELKKKGFFCSEATFGKKLKYSSGRFRYDGVAMCDNNPQNLHEYDVIIIDMDGTIVNYSYGSININSVKNKEYFFPNIDSDLDFFPSALTSSFIAEDFPQSGIFIIFASEFIEEKCNVIVVRDNKKIEHPGYSDSNYGFFINITNSNNVIIQNKKGNQIFLSCNDNKLKSILTKFLPAFHYQVIFSNVDFFNDNSEINDCPYKAVMTNKEEEVVAFSYQDQKKYMLVLPQMDNKEDLIADLLNDYFPTIYPDLFPGLTNFNWKKDPFFNLPNEDLYQKDEKKENERHGKALEKIIQKRQKNLLKFGYLHQLLTETGDLLVSAVIEYLKWAGYSNVVDMDKESKERKEDIQVKDGNSILIFEVKGIEGLPTDSECSQISKHRRRLEKENPNCNIFPLFVVNYQRFIDPRNRKRNPFSADQVDYALNDERGLITTYQLYQWFLWEEKRFLSKADIRNQLKKPQYISLIPDCYIEIGEIAEYFPKHFAFIIIPKVRINVGDQLLFEKDENTFFSKIVSIEINDVQTDSASQQEAGVIVESHENVKGYTVYIRNGSSENHENGCLYKNNKSRTKPHA